MNMIRVVVFAPGQPGVAKDVSDELESLQAIVGGLIEEVRISNGVFRGTVSGANGLIAIVNEEGRLDGLPYNRCGLVGTFFVTRHQGDEYGSLTDSDVLFVCELFEPI